MINQSEAYIRRHFFCYRVMRKAYQMQRASYALPLAGAAIVCLLLIANISWVAEIFGYGVTSLVFMFFFACFFYEICISVLLRSVVSWCEKKMGVKYSRSFFEGKDVLDPHPVSYQEAFPEEAELLAFFDQEVSLRGIASQDQGRPPSVVRKKV